jgi:hypothetical protein
MTARDLFSVALLLAEHGKRDERKPTKTKTGDCPTRHTSPVQWIFFAGKNDTPSANARQKQK